MAGVNEYNSDLDVQGTIKILTVPNSIGTVLTYNSVSREISTRTNAQIISDLGLNTLYTAGNHISLVSNAITVTPTANVWITDSTAKDRLYFGTTQTTDTIFKLGQVGGVFSIKNSADADLFSVNSAGGVVRINSLAGTGNRIIQADLSGSLFPTNLDPAKVITTDNLTSNLPTNQWVLRSGDTMSGSLNFTTNNMVNFNGVNKFTGNSADTYVMGGSTAWDTGGVYLRPQGTGSSLGQYVVRGMGNLEMPQTMGYIGRKMNTSRTFNKVYQTHTGATSQTGILSIKFPQVNTSATMFDVVIKLYSYQTNSIAELRVSFYRQANNVINTSAGLSAYITTTASFPTKVVNVGIDVNSLISINLGETSTSWLGYLSFEVERMETKFTGYDADWGSGWSHAFETDVSTYIVLRSVPVQSVGGAFLGIGQQVTANGSATLDFNNPILGNYDGYAPSASTNQPEVGNGGFYKNRYFTTGSITYLNQQWSVYNANRLFFRNIILGNTAATPWVEIYHTGNETTLLNKTIRAVGNGIVLANQLQTASTTTVRNSSMWASTSATDKFLNANSGIINFTALSGYSLSLSYRDGRIGFRTEENAVHGSWLEIIHDNNLDTKATALGFIKSSAIPAQVNIIQGTGITVSGTYPNITITNAAPNIVQALSLSGNVLTLSNGGGSVTLPINTYTGSNGINVTGTVISPVYGTTANTIAQGNDSRFHNPVTLGTSNGLSLSTQVLSLALATTTIAGAMSSADKTKLDDIIAGTLTTLNTGTSTTAVLWSPLVLTQWLTAKLADKVDKTTTVSVNGNTQSLSGNVSFTVPTYTASVQNIIVNSPTTVNPTARKTRVNVLTNIGSGALTITSGQQEGDELVIVSCGTTGGDFNFNIDVIDDCNNKNGTSVINIGDTSRFWWSASDNFWLQV